MPKHLFLRILPLLVLWFVWGFNIILFDSVEFNYTIHPYTWTIIILSIFTLSVGYLLVLFLNNNQNFTEQGRLDRNISIEVIHRFLLVISLITLLGNLLYLNELANEAGSVIKFFSNPIKARIFVTQLERQSISNWNPILAFTNYLASFNLVGVLLGGYYYVFAKKYKIIATFPIFNSILFSLISFQRYSFVQVTVTWIFCILYSLYLQDKSIRKIQTKKILTYILLTLLISFGFILGMVLLRVDYGKGDIDLLKTSVWALKSMKFYLVGEIVGLDKYLLNSDTYLYGLSLFRGFIKWFIRIGIYDSSIGMNAYYEFSKVGKSMVNTYTYIRPFYEDFGVYGLLILNFIFGILGSISIHSLMKKFSFTKLYLSSLVFFGYFLSFFNFTLLNLTMYLFLLILIIIIEKMMIIKTFKNSEFNVSV